MSSENPVKTILVLSANPKGTNPLRLDEEIREIEQGLQRARQRDNFAFKSGQAMRDFEIHRYILDYEPQIIHFSGHGAGEAGLIFEDEIGQQKLVDAEALAGLFELFVPQIECVVLNACDSEIQAKAIAKHIDYVIGMKKEIGDTAAIKFAVGFYDALGAGRDFEFAYKLGCRFIRMAGIPENLTPELLRKQGFSEESIDTTPLTTSPSQDDSRIIVVSPLPTEEESNIIEYRQKVEEFASDGVISEIESFILNDLQRKLGLINEQVSLIQKEVLETYEIYKQQFNKKVAAQGYPLKEKAQAELKKLQNYYKIKNEYINLLNQEAEKQQQQKENKRLLQQQEPEKSEYEQQEEEQRLRQKQEQEKLEYQRQQAELQKQREKEKSPSIIQTQPFEFETATLTVKSSGFLGIRRSDEIDFSRKQAEYFKEDLGNGIFLEMVRIPNGSFLMGSPEGETGHSNNESPQHTVNIQPFFMGKFPVTQGQYEAIMGKNRSEFQGKNKPVECVTWDNAYEFCSRLSQKCKKTYRLPSEAEWEYVCRAGTKTPFHFGKTITTDLANYRGIDVNPQGNLYQVYYGSAVLKCEYREQTIDVGSFWANALGLRGTHGNVWEWCQDTWHENYNGAPTNGTPWLDYNERCRVIRGGSWFSLPAICRSASRSYCYVFQGSYEIGFRVVCSS